jgi:hypothetical protein
MNEPASRKRMVTRSAAMEEAMTSLPEPGEGRASTWWTRSSGSCRCRWPAAVSVHGATTPPRTGEQRAKRRRPRPRRSTCRRNHRPRPPSPASPASSTRLTAPGSFRTLIDRRIFRCSASSPFLICQFLHGKFSMIRAARELRRQRRCNVSGGALCESSLNLYDLNAR